MGWSCRKEASDTLKVLEDNAFNQTGISNVFFGENGKKYMFEVSNKEHADGKIGVEILQFVDETRVLPKAKTFISPTGKVSNRVLKKLLAK